MLAGAWPPGRGGARMHATFSARTRSSRTVPPAASQSETTMTERTAFRSIALIAALLLAATLGAPGALAQGQKVLKFIPQADLRILDPITTTAYITRNHGYMVYDTLFAMDEKFNVRPQMVDKYETSKDGLTYTFTLRPGL